MIRNSSHTQGTSTADLIHLQTTSTSTSDFFTSSHVATQTEERPTLTPPHLSRSLEDRQTRRDDVGTDTESDSSDEEEEEASEGEATDEETSPKLRMLEEEQQRRRDDEEETSSIRLESSVENIRAEESSREAPAAEITIPAVDKVEIIQNPTIINKTYVAGCFDFNWATFLEEKISEQFSRAQQTQERHFKSIERSLKKKIKTSKATLKECMRQLLRSQATDNKAQIEELQQEVAQLREDIDKKQQERTELEKQAFDQLAKLAANQKEAMEKEKEGKRVVFSLGGKHKRVLERVWTGLKESQMVQLMKRLYQKFKIKLRQIAVDCGMQFVLDVPTENAEALEEQVWQAAIQETILEEIVPGDFQAEVEWEAPVPFAGECELKPPVQVSEVPDDDDLVEDRGTSDQGFVPAAQESSMVFDPRAAVLESSSQTEIPTTMTEVENCRTTSLLITKSRLLICTNFYAKKVTCTLLDSQCTHIEASFDLDAPPWDLALFVNDVIAVASNTNVILLLAVKRHEIRLLKPVKTVRRYIGVTSFGDGDILVVSSLEDSLGPALIDVITDGGKVLWRVADRHTLPQLLFPACLHMRNRDVLVSDKNGLIHRVDYSSGTTRPALYHPDLKSPGQVTTDSKGLSVFVSSCQNKCVLVYSITSGQWRTLLTGAEHGERGRDIPQAVGVTEDGMVVVAWDEDEDRTVVIVYPDLDIGSLQGNA